MKAGDEAPNLNINVTPNPETALKPKDSQSACQVIVHGMSHMLSTLSCQFILIYRIKFILLQLLLVSYFISEIKEPMRSNIDIILVLIQLKRSS